MAQRRMFSLKVADTDAFIDMPHGSQVLYFHLALRADDEGFVSNPNMIIRMLSACEDDMKVLYSRRFIIPFESGVCVIKHWFIHNYIQNDRKDKTQWTRERELLTIDDETKKYRLTEQGKGECIQNGYKMDTQVSIGKVSIGKYSNNTSQNLVSIKYTEDDMRLARLLYDLILENTPTHKEPTFTKWADEVRLMREQDKRTPEQIEFLVRWAQSSSFWRANILSIKKLREKFDTLVAQVKRDTDSKKKTGKGKTIIK